jgi:hypothetical protein
MQIAQKHLNKEEFFTAIAGSWTLLTLQLRSVHRF